MVPGVGGGELVVIAIVALVVVGPKDLPKLLRQLGRFVGKMRAMADDFRQSFDDMARQSELDDLRKEVEALRTGQSVPIIDDVKSQMKAIEGDINSGLRNTPSITVPQIDPQLANPQLANPQLDGMPPKWNAGEAPPAIMPETATESEIVVKKPRARKPAAVIKAIPAETFAPEPVAEPASEPTDLLPEPPVKPKRRVAKKKIVS